MPILVEKHSTIPDLLVMKVLDPWNATELSNSIVEANQRILEHQSDNAMSVIVDGSDSTGFPLVINLMPILTSAFMNFRGHYGIFTVRNAIGMSAMEMLVRRMGKRARNFAFVGSLDEAYQKLEQMKDRDTRHDDYF